MEKGKKSTTKKDRYKKRRDQKEERTRGSRNKRWITGEVMDSEKMKKIMELKYRVSPF